MENKLAIVKDYNKETKYFRAKERVEQLRKFYGNLTSYVIVVSVLAVINYWADGWSYMWFLWVAFGWGIGLFFHALKIFNLNPFFGKDWEQRKIREFMEDEEHKSRWE
ncbi:MAG TPA: 2TM domain-containing protein [Eudoraea sp.]|nr:2TM domain-containing protein [Eudoraea sp.]